MDEKPNLKEILVPKNESYENHSYIKINEKEIHGLFLFKLCQTKPCIRPS